MKSKVVKVCDKVGDDLGAELPGLRQVMENDHVLEEKLESFSEKLPDDLVGDFSELQHELCLARRFARMAALQLDHDVQDKAGLANELTEVKSLVEESDDYNNAVIEIERRAHQHTGSLSDIVKSLFMWKDSPEEHLK